MSKRKPLRILSLGESATVPVTWSLITDHLMKMAETHLACHNYMYWTSLCIDCKRRKGRGLFVLVNTLIWLSVWMDLGEMFVVSSENIFNLFIDLLLCFWVYLKWLQRKHKRRSLILIRRSSRTTVIYQSKELYDWSHLLGSCWEYRAYWKL